MTPFEIRLELLKMAKEMLENNYFGERERISSDWHIRVQTAERSGATPPEHPGFPPYPSEDKIIEKAKLLNVFVSKA